MATWTERAEFVDNYRKMCEKYKLYIDTGYGHPLYVMEKLYADDNSFEATMTKLNEDIG